MRMKTGDAITLIVEEFLKVGTKNKILYVCVDVRYLSFPHTEKDENSIANEIRDRTVVHYIFSRPTSYTKVLRREDPTSFSLQEQKGKIFEITAYHDSCWNYDGVESDLYKIHQRILKKVERKYKKIAKKDMPQVEKNDQPNYCDLRVRLFNGDIGYEYDRRKYRLKIDDRNFNFVQVKKEKN